MIIQRFAALQWRCLLAAWPFPVLAALLVGLSHAQGLVAIYIRVS